MDKKSPNRVTGRKTGNGNGNANAASGSVGRLLVGGLALTLGLGVAGCSWLPDELNISRYIEGDDVEYADERPSEEFPNLADVPDNPRPGGSDINLTQTEQGLIADRDAARYTDDVLRSQYAENDSFDDMAVARAGSANEVAEPGTKMKIPVEKSEAMDLAEDRRIDAGGMTSTSVNFSSLAEERRIDGIEPASAAVLADRTRASLAEERRLIEARAAARERNLNAEANNLADERRVLASGTTRRVAAAAEPSRTRKRLTRRDVVSAVNKPLTLDGFRAIFNDRFVASGGLAAPKQIAQRSMDTRQSLNVEDRNLSPILQLNQADGPSVSFLAATINFATGSSNLAGEDNAHLKEVGALYKDFGGVLRVVGHASSRTRDLDPETRQLANFSISLERANAVASALMRQGVPADKLEVVAMADNEPLSHEYQPAGERENQRTDIYIEY